MQQRLLSRTPVADEEDWCDWRRLALGMEIRIDPGEWTYPSRGTILVVQPVGLEVDTESELTAAGESDLDLDLLLAREIARLHGGDLWASSAGGGDAVILLLQGGET